MNEPPHIDSLVVGELAPAADEVSAKGAAPTHRLPTPRIAFPKQLDLLRAYAAASDHGTQAVDNNSLAGIVKMSTGTVSLGNPFFAEAGLIRRADAGRYTPARAVLNFARVHQWDPAKAGGELAPVLGETWFAKALLPRLAFGALPEDDAIHVLANAAQAGPGYKSQIRTLLDYLQTAGLIVVNGGMVARATAPRVAARGEASADADTPAPVAPSAPSAGSVGDAPRLPLLIQGLLEQLPADGTWTRREADQWLELARLTIEVVYTISPPEKEVGSG